MSIYDMILVGQLNFFYEILVPLFLMMRRQERRSLFWLRWCLSAALCLACAALAVPASASSANTAVQAAVMLGGVDSGQDAAAPLTRGQLARLLTAFSPYRRGATPTPPTSASRCSRAG